MWKSVVAGVAALVLASATPVFAQQGPDRSEGQRWRPNIEDMRAYGEARIAGLKAGLQLNAEQEKNWPAFEQAIRDYTRLRLDRMAAMRSEAPADPIDRMRRRADALSQNADVLKRLVDAMEPLYRSLDDNQKRRFAYLSGRAGHRMGHPGYHGRRGEGPREFYHNRRGDDDRRGRDEDRRSR